MQLTGFECKCGLRWETAGFHDSAECQCGMTCKMVYQAETDRGPRKLTDGRNKFGSRIMWPAMTIPQLEDEKRQQGLDGIDTMGGEW